MNRDAPLPPGTRVKYWLTKLDRANDKPPEFSRTTGSVFREYTIDALVSSMAWVRIIDLDVAIPLELVEPATLFDDFERNKPSPKPLLCDDCQRNMNRAWRDIQSLGGNARDLAISALLAGLGAREAAASVFGGVLSRQGFSFLSAIASGLKSSPNKRPLHATTPKKKKPRRRT